jgi:hypothetical protein
MSDEYTEEEKEEILEQFWEEMLPQKEEPPELTKEVSENIWDLFDEPEDDKT